MNTTVESVVIREVKEVIKLTGIKLQRINTGNFKGHYKTANAGTLDFEGYDKRGRFCAIECKRPDGGRLSPEQAERIADINRAGGVAFVAHSGIEAMELLQRNGCIGLVAVGGVTV